MMTLINAIPDNIGWMLAGGACLFALEMLGLLIGTVVDMIRDRLTNYDDEESEVC